jgi:hypothetical protein
MFGQEQSQDLHAVKKMLSARDKALCAGKPFAEAVKMLREKYKLTEEAAAGFVAYQRTLASGGGAASNPNERWHLKFDDDEGKWIKVPQPGDHPGKTETES